MSAQYSDEMINAFVDDELDGRERESFRQAMAADDDLYQRVKAVCDLKAGLKRSYADISFNSESTEKASTGGNWRQSVAAIVLVGLGVLIGWYGGSAQQSVTQAGRIEGVRLEPLNLQKPNKIVLHVSSSENHALEKTMQKVEFIIEEYRHNRLPFEMEIIANSGGIDLLRRDISPYRERIEQIMQANDNVSFIACSNALEKLRTRGIQPGIIAHTKTGATAVDQIVKRLQQGWVYVKV